MKKKYLFLLLASTILANNASAKDLLLPDPSNKNIIQNEDIIIDYSIIEELEKAPTTIKVNGRELLLPNPKIKKQEIKKIKKKAIKKVEPKKDKPIIKKAEPTEPTKKETIEVKDKADIIIDEKTETEETVTPVTVETAPIAPSQPAEPVKEKATEEATVEKEATKTVEPIKDDAEKPADLITKTQPEAEETLEEENITEIFFKGENVSLSKDITDIIDSTIKDIKPSDNVKITISAYNKNDGDSDVFKNRRLCFDRVIAIRHYLNQFGFDNFKVKVINTDNAEKTTGLVELKLEIKE